MGHRAGNSSNQHEDCCSGRSGLGAARRRRWRQHRLEFLVGRLNINSGQRRSDGVVDRAFAACGCGASRWATAEQNATRTTCRGERPSACGQSFCVVAPIRQSRACQTCFVTTDFGMSRGKVFPASTAHSLLHPARRLVQSPRRTVKAPGVDAAARWDAGPEFNPDAEGCEQVADKGLLARAML